MVERLGRTGENEVWRVRSQHRRPALVGCHDRGENDPVVAGASALEADALRECARNRHEQQDTGDRGGHEEGEHDCQHDHGGHELCIGMHKPRKQRAGNPAREPGTLDCYRHHQAAQHQPERIGGETREHHFGRRHRQDHRQREKDEAGDMFRQRADRPQPDREEDQRSCVHRLLRYTGGRRDEVHRDGPGHHEGG